MLFKFIEIGLCDIFQIIETFIEEAIIQAKSIDIFDECASMIIPWKYLYSFIIFNLQ